jgi:hypothetical protein
MNKIELQNSRLLCGLSNFSFSILYTNKLLCRFKHMFSSEEGI